MYYTEIPGAYAISKGGAPLFKEANSDVQKNANYSLTAASAYLHMETILDTPGAMEDIFRLQTKMRADIAKAPPGSNIGNIVRGYVARANNPVEKIWFQNLNDLITSKLRIETGAAYNENELATTLDYFPNSTDWVNDYDERDDAGKQEARDAIYSKMKKAREWVLNNAKGLVSYRYLEGLLYGNYKPDNTWLDSEAANIKLLESVYPQNKTVDNNSDAFIEGS